MHRRSSSARSPKHSGAPRAGGWAWGSRSQVRAVPSVPPSKRAMRSISPIGWVWRTASSRRRTSSCTRCCRGTVPHAPSSSRRCSSRCAARVQGRVISWTRSRPTSPPARWRQPQHAYSTSACAPPPIGSTGSVNSPDTPSTTPRSASRCRFPCWVRACSAGRTARHPDNRRAPVNNGPAVRRADTLPVRLTWDDHGG